jgi:hypothetical protein
MSRLSVICLMILLKLFIIAPNTASACIGPSYGLGSFLDNLESFSTIVTGRIITVNDSGTNAILEVDQILKGDVNSNRIVLMRNTIHDIESYRTGRDVVRPCTGMAPPVPTGARFVAGLRQARYGYYDATIIPENTNGFFELERLPEDRISRSYEETIAYLSERLQVTSRPSQPGPAPRPVAIHLFTDVEEHVIPLHSLETVRPIQEILCVAPVSTIGLLSNCTESLYAPNNIDNVSLFAEGTTTKGFTSFSFPFRYAVAGDSATFSSNSDLLTVWRSQELRIYATPRQFRFANYPSDRLDLLTTLSFTDDDLLFSGAGVWHPNGRIFAFSSQTGIWFWDVLTPDSQPVLFMAADEHPLLVRHFSPGGNYLAVEENSVRYHLDIHSFHEYPDGEFSPDDELLAAYDTQANGLADLQIYRVLPTFEPILVFQEPDPEIWDEFTLVPYTYAISQFEWISNNDLLFAACGSGYPPYTRETEFGADWCKVGRITFRVESTWIDGFQFDYDPVTESLITLLDGNRVNLNGEILDFSLTINEPIIRVELEPLIDLHHRNFE